MAFIPMAEETGLIVALGRWALDAACRQAAIWAAADTRPDGRRAFVSVNLSARQFTQGDLVEDVVRPPARTGSIPTRSSWRSPRAWTTSEAGIRTLSEIRDTGGGSCSTTSGPATPRWRT